MMMIPILSVIVSLCVDENKPSLVNTTSFTTDRSWYVIRRNVKTAKPLSSSIAHYIAVLSYAYRVIN